MDHQELQWNDMGRGGLHEAALQPRLRAALASNLHRLRDLLYQPAGGHQQRQRLKRSAGLGDRPHRLWGTPVTT